MGNMRQYANMKTTADRIKEELSESWDAYELSTELDSDKAFVHLHNAVVLIVQELSRVGTPLEYFEQSFRAQDVIDAINKPGGAEALARVGWNVDDLRRAALASLIRQQKEI